MGILQNCAGQKDGFLTSVVGILQNFAGQKCGGLARLVWILLLCWT